MQAKVVKTGSKSLPKIHDKTTCDQGPSATEFVALRQRRISTLQHVRDESW